MEIFNRDLIFSLLIGCAASATFSADVLADYNGVIVLQRDVQPLPIGCNAGNAPYPTTVNANHSARIVQATNNAELSDGDFVNIASGYSISGNINQPGTAPPRPERIDKSQRLTKRECRPRWR